MKTALAMAVLAALGGVLAACGHEAKPVAPRAAQPPTTDPPAYVVDCAHRVETARSFPPGHWRRRSVVAGPLALYLLRTHTRHPEQYDQPHGSGVESVAIVRADRQVTLTIPATEPPGVSLLWGPGFHGVKSVTFVACPAWTHRFSGHGRVGRYTLFQGGLGVEHSRCATLEIWPYGRARPLTRSVGFGKRCPS